VGLYYCHRLIPTHPSFCPTPDKIAAFLESLINLGVVGNAPTLRGYSLKQVVPQVRQGRNPMTGETLVIRGPSRLPDRSFSLATINELATAVGDAVEYDVHVSNETILSPPPLPVEFDGPYYLGVCCHVRTQPESMSCVEGAGKAETSHAAFRDLGSEPPMGRFTDPHTATIIEVPNAGYARFWIDFELGKFIVPTISDGDLRILDPRIVELAAGCFQFKFAQGCAYG
jgi:hypothetical protein